MADTKVVTAPAVDNDDAGRHLAERANSLEQVSEPYCTFGGKHLLSKTFIVFFRSVRNFEVDGATTMVS